MKKLLSLMLAMLLTASVCAVSVHGIATPLTGGNSQSSAALIPSFGVDYVSSLDTAGEVDWFKFKTIDTDAYYDIRFENYSLGTGWNSSWSPNVHLFDANMKPIDWGANGTVEFNKKLEKNTTYFIKIYMGSNATESTGNYQITVSYKTDQIPDVKEQAYEISLNTKRIDSLDGWGDIDWFKFKAPVTGEYSINFTGHDLADGWNDVHSSNICLYDDYMKEIGRSWGKTSTIKANLEASQYYFIEIRMGSQSTTSIGNYDFTVECKAVLPQKQLKNIAIVQQPSKTTYKVGESLNTAGMVVRAAYDDGSTSDLTDYDVSGYNAYQTGTQTITVCATVNGITKTATFTVIVRDSTVSVALSSISLDSKPTKTSYTAGESFDASGISVRAKYSDGTSRIVETYTISDVDTSTAGIKTVTVTYTEDGVTQTCNFTVTVKQKIDFGKILSTLEKVLKALQAPAIQLLNLFLSIIKIIFG